MFTKRFISRAAGASLAAIGLLIAQPLRAESASDTARIEKLERAVELLQKQNAELKAEVNSLNSNRTAFSATDIFVNWHQFPEAQVKVGQWKAPFGLEQLTPDPSLIIIERSLPTGAITPDRQIGAQLWGKPFANIWPDQKDLLTYYAGIFNGDGRNISVNDNNNFMYVGRLESTLFKSKIWGQESSLKLCRDVLNSRYDAV